MTKQTIIPLRELAIGTCGRIKIAAFKSQRHSRASVRDSKPGHVWQNVRVLWAAMNWIQVQRDAIIIHLISMKINRFFFCFKPTNSQTLQKPSTMFGCMTLMHNAMVAASPAAINLLLLERKGSNSSSLLVVTHAQKPFLL
jgi:hypothetical protein